jgi:hypothetical protein
MKFFTTAVTENKTHLKYIVVRAIPFNETSVRGCVKNLV